MHLALALHVVVLWFCGFASGSGVLWFCVGVYYLYYYLYLLLDWIGLDWIGRTIIIIIDLYQNNSILSCSFRVLSYYIIFYSILGIYISVCGGGVVELRSCVGARVHVYMCGLSRWLSCIHVCRRRRTYLGTYLCTYLCRNDGIVELWK